MINKKYLRYLSGGGIGFLLILFILWGPPGVMDMTSSPEFCNSCHVMNSQHEAWFMSGLHRNIKCVDCHLPNNNPVNHYVWKGIDGARDFVFFHGNVFVDPISISSHGKKVLQANCERCHEGMVSMIKTNDRNCWDCHRRVNHKITAITVNK